MRDGWHTLTPELTERCVEFGHKVLENYDNDKRPKSKAMSLNGIEKNPHAQACGKVAECGVALDLELDPLEAIDWGYDRADSYDLISKGKTIDVKSAELPNPAYLIWPISKNDIWHTASDYLILASGMMVGGLGRARTICYASREEFDAKHHVSDGTELPRLPMVGTWYMRQEECHPFDASRRNG